MAGTVFSSTVLLPALYLPQCIAVFSLLFVGRKEGGLEGEGGRSREGGGRGEGWGLCIAHLSSHRARLCASQRLIGGGEGLAGSKVTTEFGRYWIHSSSLWGPCWRSQARWIHALPLRLDLESPLLKLSLAQREEPLEGRGASGDPLDGCHCSHVMAQVGQPASRGRPEYVRGAHLGRGVNQPEALSV